MTRLTALLAPLLLLSCQRADAPPAPTPPPAAPAPIQAQPLPTAAAVDLTRFPWAEHAYTIDLDGAPTLARLTNRRATLPGPTPETTLAIHLDEVAFGDLDGDGQQDAITGLSVQVIRLQPAGPPTLERAWVHIDLHRHRDGAPARAARHTEPGASVTWLDIADVNTLNAGVLTRPQEKFNAVDDLTLRLDGAAFTLTDRHKSYSD